MDYEATEKRLLLRKVLKFLNSYQDLSNIDFIQNINVYMKKKFVNQKGNEFIIANNCYEALDRTYTKEELEQFLQAVENPIFRKMMAKVPQFINEYEGTLNRFKKTG
ncbi:MAG: hypothetical protein GWO07_10820 [Candidatus Dadabacteria bacterium]|nr:hypothetical protein [Candidatus Dadabacteria bacterium]NIS09233.1 hypothetical protein [Candidatus Dadabacteria bacterium]NIV41881.1 hypothetical protein [Candidatus Dadabacteria bacterium]NIX15779.1 hypothetical protein [Candidatus Dadabacteria bacterium]NIY22509.1 hypothetical protein [Candidatus Dadabacteria bacterium]